MRYIRPLKETPLMRKTPLILFGVVALTVGVAGCVSKTDASSGADAAGKGVRVEIGDSSLGPILTDQDGRTLYAFADDKGGGTSTCTGHCLAVWPALITTGAATAGKGIDTARLSTVTRAEGTVQMTYQGWPLYYYVGDQGPGDVDGQDVDDVWFVLDAEGKLVRTHP
jgi:predicted lipoprotein with Yx(FWY)xxD motif